MLYHREKFQICLEILWGFFLQLKILQKSPNATNRLCFVFVSTNRGSSEYAKLFQEFLHGKTVGKRNFAGYHEDVSYFFLLVTESQKVINCFKQKLLPADTLRTVYLSP
jgi:hypothetical protein